MLLQPLRGTLGVRRIEHMQLNLGTRCMLTCLNCPLSCLPSERDMMGWAVILEAIELARRLTPVELHLTGGAPELNPHFRQLLKTLSPEFPLTVYTSLAALTLEGLEDILDLYARYRVKLVAALPGYLENYINELPDDALVPSQIRVLHKLNDRGYGMSPDLQLSLILHQPLGPHAPSLRIAYDRTVRTLFEEILNVKVTALIPHVNVPLWRFMEILTTLDEDDLFVQMQVSAQSGANLPGLNCQNGISVAWDGLLYDCDFNQALERPCVLGESPNIMSRNIGREELERRHVLTGPQCLGCVSGTGPAGLIWTA